MPLLMVYHTVILFFIFISDAHEAQVKELNTQLKDLQKAKEGVQREVNELKTQLKMVEEARDNVRRDLIDAHRKIREGDFCVM